MLYEELTNPDARAVGMLVQEYYHRLTPLERGLVDQQWQMVVRFGDYTVFRSEAIESIHKIVAKYHTKGEEHVSSDILDSGAGRDD